MSRILIIDNNRDPDCWGAADLRRMASLLDGATLYTRRAPEDDLPASPDPFDQVIVSGSKTSAMEDAPWVFKLHDFIRRTLDAGKPFLGVCYGHQSLVRALGGKETVRKAAQSEYGWTSIEVVESSPLMEGLSRSFYTYSSHEDEVASLPSGLKRLARSSACEIQACQLEGRPVFGIQFHPEKRLEKEKLYDPKVGETLFRNFLSL